MERLFSKLGNNTKMLEILEQEKINMETLPYYDIFGTEQERQKDIQAIEGKRKQYLRERFTLLENIQLEAEKGKSWVSEKQREIALYNEQKQIA